MKYIFCVLALLLTAPFAWSQDATEIKTVEKIDSFYYLITLTVTENDTPYPDSARFRRLLGDSLTAHNRIFSDAVEDRLSIAGAVRRALDLSASNRRWNDYGDLYEAVTGQSLKEAAEDQYASGFTGSCRVTVPVALLTLENVAEISTESLAAILASGQNRVSFAGEIYLTNSGRMKMRNLDTNATWNMDTDGPRSFEIRSFCGDNYNFFFESSVNGRLRFTPAIAITNRNIAPYVIIRN